jgi:hypothetical protein
LPALCARHREGLAAARNYVPFKELAKATVRRPVLRHSSLCCWYLSRSLRSITFNLYFDPAYGRMTIGIAQRIRQNTREGDAILLDAEPVGSVRMTPKANVI